MCAYLLDHLTELRFGLVHETHPALVLISLDEERRGGWEVSVIGLQILHQMATFIPYTQGSLPTGRAPSLSTSLYP